MFLILLNTNSSYSIDKRLKFSRIDIFIQLKHNLLIIKFTIAIFSFPQKYIVFL